MLITLCLFDLTNYFSGEQLTLKAIDEYNECFLFVRCPIVRNESKWTKWEKETTDWQFNDQWNGIDIMTNDEDDIGDGLLGTIPGPSDQQQK
ncbi:hypothetical protein niasHT_032963 [Heterodera trifolii]|uniref:Uncharacterized protein n=1 Tax=Heterodera trifolii TaxID=157864 RepID=A0ABD2I6S7_9BILA